MKTIGDACYYRIISMPKHGATGVPLYLLIDTMKVVVFVLGQERGLFVF